MRGHGGGDAEGAGSKGSNLSAPSLSEVIEGKGGIGLTECIVLCIGNRMSCCYSVLDC